VMPVEVFTAQTDKEIPLLERPRIGGDAIKEPVGFPRQPPVARNASPIFMTANVLSFKDSSA
jgi:hypothetical protein